MSAKYTFAVYETIVGSAKEKIVLLKLADNANDDGVCWPGMDYLCRHTELSRSSLIRALKSLEEKGFIQVQRRKTDNGKQNLSNLYKLTLPSFTMTLPQCQDDTTPSVRMTPEPNNNKSNNKPSYPVGINPDLLASISNHWNELMTTQPTVDLTKQTQINKKRWAKIKKIIKDHPDYTDHEYWEGHISYLATLPELQWQRDNKQLTFDQAVQLEKFERNLGLMKMGAGK